MQRILTVFVLVLALAGSAAAQDADAVEPPQKEKELWWTITALYSASLALLVLEQTHRQPCDGVGCEPGKRTLYTVGATASALAGVSLNIWEVRRTQHAVVVGNDAASIGYSVKW